MTALYPEYTKYKNTIFTFSRDNGQKLATPTGPGTSEIWLNLPEINFLVSISNDGSFRPFAAIYRKLYLANNVSFARLIFAAR